MMITRRNFIKFTAAVLAWIALPFKGAYPVKKKSSVKKAAVIWYSQAGNTERYGRVISNVFLKNGIETISGDYRHFDTEKLNDCGLIVMGSPVFYYEIPVNFSDWIGRLQGLEGKNTGAFVTYGGAGGNQHNASMELAEKLKSGGATVRGIDMFSNMSTFAPTWSIGNESRILKYRHLPDENSFSEAAGFAERILDNIQNDAVAGIKSKFSFNNILKGGPSIRMTKLMMSNHEIDTTMCINCGTCEEKCPSGAIDINKHSLNFDRCIACMGCINNCPAGAFKTTFMRKKVYGFGKFLEMHNIKIKEPV